MHDHFDRLGLPRRFALDAAQLEQHYLAQSRAVHPDYHADRPEAELTASTELSAALNEAYTTLKDPYRRAEYLLTLEGGPTAAEHKALHAGFLNEMLELRERIEEARGQPAALAQLESEFTARHDALMDEIAGRFNDYENHEDNDPIRPELRVQIRNLLNAAKYVHGLIRDLHNE